jgi:hypothetical protein
MKRIVATAWVIAGLIAPGGCTSQEVPGKKVPDLKQRGMKNPDVDRMVPKKGENPGGRKG